MRTSYLDEKKTYFSLLLTTWAKMSLMQDEELEELRNVFIAEAARAKGSNRTACQLFANLAQLRKE